MAKQNVKAGATQLEQDLSAADAAAAEKSAAADAAGEDNQQANGELDLAAAAGEATDKAGAAEGDKGAEAPPAIEQGDDVILKAPVDVKPENAAPPKAPAAAVVQEVQARPLTKVDDVVVIEAQPAPPKNGTLQETLDRILRDVPEAHRIDVTRVLIYIERMAPKRPVDVKTGTTEQAALYRSIQNIINRQEAYFRPLFTALLAIFKSESQGALGDRYRNRFMDNIVLGVGDRKAFTSLTHVLFLTADPKSREVALRQLNLEAALQNGLTEQGRQRVLEYFGV